MLMIRELFSYKRNQGHDAGFFYRVGKSSLVLGAGSVPFRRIDLSLGIHESSDKIGILKINLVHLAFAEKAGFFFSFDYIIL